jgi:threonylcarbamoyladenosine tRNA methylthiotransferase MtaB
MRRLIMGGCSGSFFVQGYTLASTDTQADVRPVGRLINVEGYHVENFGCRANRAEGEAIASGLRQAGLREAVDLETATVIVLNTCSVTAEGDRDARAFLRRVRRVSPGARVVFTGCYAQRAPEEVAALDGVDVVVGNSHKSLVVKAALGEPALGESMLSEPVLGSGLARERGLGGLIPVDLLLDRSSSAKREPATVWHDPLFAHSEIAALPFAADAHQTRPNLKIQDGCGNRCSFCIIPVTRGPSRSVSLDECLRAVDQFAGAGGKELVLSGINLGRWGRDLSPVARFEELVAAILKQTALPRLRISSVEPMDWSSELIGLFRQYGQDSGAGPQLARHAHLPLQSGSDAVLRAMHRRYRPWHYAAKVEEIRAALPDAAIGADVMIGFPGESDVLFRETYDFIERMPFTYLHIFPFSARPGTAAFAMYGANPVHGEAVKERKAALKALISKKNEAFRARFVGGELSVVTLRGGDEFVTEALSDNFIQVAVSAGWAANELLRVRVQGFTADGLVGGGYSRATARPLVGEKQF